MKLNNELITLRAVEPSDLDIIFKWENDTSIWKASNTLAPFSKHQICEYIKNYSSNIYDQLQLRLMIIENKTHDTVGMIDLHDFDPFHSRADIGILVSPEKSNIGLGEAAANVVIKYAQEFLGLHQLSVKIPIDNTPSIALFRKLKFQECGILKDWIKTGQDYCDVVIMQLILS